MKTKQILVTILCFCTLLTLPACGKSESFSLKESQPPAPSIKTTATPAPSVSDDTEAEYIGNKVSKIFHLPTCNTLPNKKNRRNLYTRESALKSGYKPCKNCNP